MTSKNRSVHGLVATAVLLAVTGLLVGRMPAEGAAPGPAAAHRGPGLPARGRGPGDPAGSTTPPAPVPAVVAPVSPLGTDASPGPSGGAPGTSGGAPGTTGGAPGTSGGAPGATRPGACPTPHGGTVTHAPGADRTVALTFDDGPGDDTPALLDVLTARGVRATFFVIGGNAHTHPDLVARESAEGHLIGDHTWHHTYPRQVAGGWTGAYLRAELDRTNQTITQASGHPVCWFRPPGGFLPAPVLPTARALGMNVALWSVDPRDWQLQSSGPGSARRRAQITDTIVARVSAGLSQQNPIILMHDGGGPRRAGVAAVSRIIDLYREHGYRFVRLDGVGS
jgi:peptidoglycan-N-acetylglucosamine deacetylase